MDKAEFAELILRMTTTPESAVSIVGDLVQEANARGTFWFWTSLLRTAASLVYRTLADAPFQLTGNAIVGSIIQSRNAVILLLFLQWWLAILSGTTIEHPLAPYPPGHPLAILTGVLSSLAAAYLFGRWLVRKAPNRELPVYGIAWAITQAVWLLIIRNTPGAITAYGPTGDLIELVFMSVGCTICIFAGIARIKLSGLQSPNQLK
jgi:hypothetical protein